MLYDYYVATCKPLIYTVIISQRVCWILVPIPYLYGMIVSPLHIIKILNLFICGHKIVSYFYCDFFVVVTFIFLNKHENEVIFLTLSALNLLYSLLVAIVSLLFILTAIILRVKSAEGKRKAFPYLWFLPDSSSCLLQDFNIYMFAPYVNSFHWHW